MKKIISSTVLFLAASCFLCAQDPVPQNQSSPNAATTYSAQKPTSPTTSSALVKSGSLKKGSSGAPAAAKFLTADLSEIYSNYDKAKKAEEKFLDDEKAAQQKMNEMIQEGIKLGEQYKELHAKTTNPSLTDEAKKKIAEEANATVQAIEEKQLQITQFQQQTNQTLTQRKQSVINLHLSDIKETCAKIAKAKGANLVLNTTGIAVMYHDGSADITEEIVEVLNSQK